MAALTMRIASEIQKAINRKFKFTKDALDRVKVPAGKDRVWVYDEHTPRLAYMKTANGAGSFYWYGKFQGRPVRARLKDSTASIEQARKWAAGKTSDAAKGVDPMAEDRAQREQMTLGELLTNYLETHAKHHKRTWEADKDQFERYFGSAEKTGSFPGWRTRGVNTIKYEDVKALHAKMGTKHGHYAANRLLALLSAMFNNARMPNPAEGVKKFKEHARERFIQADELPRFFKALRTVSGEWRDFFRLALYTGARRSNMQTMEWSEVNLDSATWTIPAAKFKTDKALSVPLVPKAVRILQRRHRKAKPDAKYVFPSYGKTGHIAEPKMAWERVCTAAGLKDIRPHDLRHTYGTYLAASGANSFAIMRAMGHRQISTTARYTNLNLDPIRQAVTGGIAAMTAASKAKPKK